MKQQTITRIFELTLDEVFQNLKAIAQSESIINNSNLIKTDMSIAIDTFIKASQPDYPNKWYFFIRKQGVEDSEHYENVKKRCEILGQAHIKIKVIYNRKDDNFSMLIVR